MIKKLIWPYLISVGLVVLFFVDAGIGGPGTIIFIIGVVGGLFASWLLPLAKGELSKLVLIISITWALAALSIFGLLSGWFTEGFGGFIWILPSAVFTLLGLVLTTIAMFKKKYK